MLTQHEPRILGNTILHKTLKWRCTRGDIYWCRLWCLMGKYRSCSEKAVVTFRWEVGFALRFVGPVHHQVPIATKTVSDFICENEENRKKKQAECYVLWHCKICNMHMQRHTLWWDRRSFYFSPCSCCSSSHCIKQERRPVCTGLTRAVETH